ncbi:hypothetical protein L1987_88500 [Smallanthus sonchifolius]|nr:hypothetical protein L1987_89375 [Smallanthus sonchifolius]KAI3668498.1 hypothetical protein L1987_88500 [Smallanthus sonchifolius]
MPDFFSLMLLSSVSCFYKAFRDSTYCDPKCSLYVQAFKPELVFLPPSYFTVSFRVLLCLLSSLFTRPLSSGRKKRSPYCWSARLSPFPKEYFRMHNLSGNSRLSSLCSSVSRPSSPSIVSSLETSVTSLKSPVSFYPIEAVVPIATVLRPLVGVLSAALAVEFFLISSATSRGLLTRLCFLSGPLLNKNVGRKSVRRLSVGKAKASLLLLLELHKKDGSGEKSYPQAFAYRMVEGGRGSNTFRLMLDHCIRDISNELSDL